MAYRKCKFCMGKGCFMCEMQREKDKEEAMKPIFEADPNNPNDMELLKNAIGADAIEKAARRAQQNGTTTAYELHYNLAVASVAQALRNHSHETATTDKTEAEIVTPMSEDKPKKKPVQRSLF